jgi:hypothetical protein
VTNVDEYSPGSDSWVSHGPLTLARYYLAVCASENRVHAFGGGHLLTTQSLDHQAYEPASATLMLLQSIPPVERVQSAAFAP